MQRTQDSLLSLKEQFSRATRDNPLIQKAYAALWAWHGKMHQMSLFSNYIMQGYLKKRAEKVKFWQKKQYYRRYFKIDFTSAVLIISEHVSDGDEDDVKQLPFSHVLDV